MRTTRQTASTGDPDVDSRRAEHTGPAMTRRTIGPVGTVARVLIGLLLIGGSLLLDYPSDGITWWDIAAALVLLPLIAVGAAAVLGVVYRRRHALVRRARTPWSVAQSVTALVVIVVVIALGTVLTFVSPVDRNALFLFFGLSMLLAAARGYEGCEILALPNFVLRRDDAIWCPLYTPIDGSPGPPTRTTVDPRVVVMDRVRARGGATPNEVKLAEEQAAAD